MNQILFLPNEAIFYVTWFKFGIFEKQRQFSFNYNKSSKKMNQVPSKLPHLEKKYAIVSVLLQSCSLRVGPGQGRAKSDALALTL